jgi:hypothetical protein
MLDQLGHEMVFGDERIILMVMEELGYFEMNITFLIKVIFLHLYDFMFQMFLVMETIWVSFEKEMVDEQLLGQ